MSLLFFDEQLYDLKILKRCAQGAVAVAFNFVRDGESAEIILEFNCAKIFVVVRDATGKHVETTGAHFDPGMAKLLALAKESLPKDKKVQKLKESR